MVKQSNIICLLIEPQKLDESLQRIATLTSEIELVKSQLETQRSQDQTAELREQLNQAKKELIDLEIIKVESIAEYETKLTEALNSYKYVSPAAGSSTSSIPAEFWPFCSFCAFSLELSIHKEQIKQHSLTIVNFEKDLKYLRELEVTQSAEIESLKRKLREAETKRSSS